MEREGGGREKRGRVRRREEGGHPPGTMPRSSPQMSMFVAARRGGRVAMACLRHVSSWRWKKCCSCSRRIVSCCSSDRLLNDSVVSRAILRRRRRSSPAGGREGSLINGHESCAKGGGATAVCPLDPRTTRLSLPAALHCWPRRPIVAPGMDLVGVVRVPHAQHVPPQFEEPVHERLRLSPGPRPQRQDGPLARPLAPDRPLHPPRPRGPRHALEVLAAGEAGEAFVSVEGGVEGGLRDVRVGEAGEVLGVGDIEAGLEEIAPRETLGGPKEAEHARDLWGGWGRD